MSNFGHGGCPGTRFMTIFGSHVQLHISNIGYMRVYEGLQALGGISSFGDRVMTICVFHVDPHISNIAYMKVYEGLQALGGISSLFS